MRGRALRPAALLAIAVAGCGTPSADLLVVERTGSVPGARLALRVTDGGEAVCNGRPAVPISSGQLIEARELAGVLNGRRDERGVAEGSPSFPAGRRTIFQFAVRTEDGTVRFADTSRGPGDLLPRLVALTRDIARGPCRLPR